MSVPAACLFCVSRRVFCTLVDHKPAPHEAGASQALMPLSRRLPGTDTAHVTWQTVERGPEACRGCGLLCPQGCRARRASVGTSSRASSPSSRHGAASSATRPRPTAPQSTRYTTHFEHICVLRGTAGILADNVRHADRLSDLRVSPFGRRWRTFCSPRPGTARRSCATPSSCGPSCLRTRPTSTDTSSRRTSPSSRDGKTAHHTIHVS